MNTDALVPVTIVTGTSARAREAAIAGRLAQDGAEGAAVILEGLPSGSSPVDAYADSAHVARIAPGCLCCTCNLVLRVTLNRLLRLRPERLYIGTAGSEHLDQLRSWLQAGPYDQLLRLMPDLETEEVA
jgi:G3E family GTPase